MLRRLADRDAGPLLGFVHNENEQREAIRNASANLMDFERELQVMARGQLLVTGSYNDVPLPVRAPDYDRL